MKHTVIFFVFFDFLHYPSCISNNISSFSPFLKASCTSGISSWLQESKQAYNGEHILYLKECASTACLPNTLQPCRKQTKAQDVKVIKVLSVTGNSCELTNKGHRTEPVNLQLALFRGLLCCRERQLSKRLYV